MERDPFPCPLCKYKGNHDPFHRDVSRDYYRCSCCHLTYVPPSQHLSLHAERAEYDKHQNSPDDPGYRKFLGRLFNPLREKLNPESEGLDFGSGPGPTLSVMFEEEGMAMTLYDPFYAPDRLALAPQNQYDFITATEVVEHLHDPAAEIALLWSLLKPGGWLGVMTKLALDEAAFSRWHYKSDPTHVCFFSIKTIDWLAGNLKAEVHHIGADVFLFQKQFP